MGLFTEIYNSNKHSVQGAMFRVQEWCSGESSNLPSMYVVGLIYRPSVTCGLNLLILYSAPPRGFSLGPSGFPNNY